MKLHQYGNCLHTKKKQRFDYMDSYGIKGLLINKYNSLIEILTDFTVFISYYGNGCFTYFYKLQINGNMLIEYLFWLWLDTICCPIIIRLTDSTC